MLSLQKHSPFQPQKVLLVILDGVGASSSSIEKGNAIAGANLPNLQKLWSNSPTIKLKAHGKAVGMPSDEDMGNSEVGHNVLGCGRIFDQGAKLVSNSIHTGSMFQGKIWKELISSCIKNNTTLHFLGLVSDGNVHSHIDHLNKMIEQSISEGITKIRIHALLDGRDVPEKSALDYILPLEEKLEAYRKKNIDIFIASGGGRMTITMDRYEADWSIVEKGWQTHVLGEGRKFSSAQEAIQTFRTEDTSVIDQYLPAFVISKDDKPIGTIQDNDSVILFNFRGDRAIEISRAFTEKEIPDIDLVNRKLKAMTGWKGEYVRGFIEAPEFFKMLSEKKFPIGNFIRDSQNLAYTPAPDVFHDLYGHLPFHTIPAYADFCCAFGTYATDSAQLASKNRRASKIFLVYDRICSS